MARIIGIDGQFGKGKSSTAIEMARRYGPDALVLTNMKVNTDANPNWHMFGDDDLLEMLRVANLKNDVERMAYCEERFDTKCFPYYDRDKFSDTLIILDEAGAIANGRSWKDFDNTLCEYLNQNRKLFCDIIVVTADGTQVEMNIRRFIEDWVYMEPLFNFWLFKHFKVVRARKKDKDGKIVHEEFTGRDENGDWIIKLRPIDYYLFTYFQPTTWRHYDDLHKNIRDPDKYLVSDSSRAVLNDFFQRRALVEQGLVLDGTIQEARRLFLSEWDAHTAEGRAPHGKVSRFRTDEEARRYKARGGKIWLPEKLDAEKKVSDAIGA